MHALPDPFHLSGISLISLAAAFNCHIDAIMGTVRRATICLVALGRPIGGGTG